MKPLFLVLLAISSLAAEPLTLKLWPEGPPGQMLPHSKATEDFIRTKAGKGTITDIHDPTINIYRPEKPNGTSVIVAPGGGYVFLSVIHEGTQVCEWLNTLGITAVLLKYRTPTRDEPAPHEKPVADAARAITLIRQHAAEWHLDSKRIGLLGFSAGGNLLAHLACDRDDSKYPLNFEQIVAGRPDFGIMIYGGGFVDSKDPTRLKEGFTVPQDAPPMFLACAHDDGQNPTAATVLYLEYKKLGIPCELHLFTKGGHGFGMRKAGNPINEWPERCAEWMQASVGFSTLADLEREIKNREAALAETSKVIRAMWICGNDAADLLDRVKRAQENLRAARSQNDKEAEARSEAELKKLQQQKDELEKLQSPGLNPESVAEHIHRLKKEKLELEARRDQLRQSSPSPP